MRHSVLPFAGLPNIIAAAALGLAKAKSDKNKNREMTEGEKLGHDTAKLHSILPQSQRRLLE